MTAAPPMRVDAATRDAVHGLLKTVEAHWRRLELDRLEPLWDGSRAPLYIAEEAAEIHTSFEALRRYWEFTRASIVKMGLELGEPEILPLAPDLVTAVYTLHWECLMKGQTTPVGGDNRACAVLRRVDGEWRFTQYIEAPLAPIVYIRELYQRSVSPGFGAAS